MACHRFRTLLLLSAVTAGVRPTRLSVDVVRRATGKSTSAGSKALLAAGHRQPTID